MDMMRRTKRSIDTLSSRKLLNRQPSDAQSILENRVKNSRCKNTRLRQVSRDKQVMI